MYTYVRCTQIEHGVPAERASPRGPKNQTSPMSTPQPIAIFFHASFLLCRPGPIPPSRRSYVALLVDAANIEERGVERVEFRPRGSRARSTEVENAAERCSRGMLADGNRSSSQTVNVTWLMRLRRTKT